MVALLPVATLLQGGVRRGGARGLEQERVEDVALGHGLTERRRRDDNRAEAERRRRWGVPGEGRRCS